MADGPSASVHIASTVPVTAASHTGPTEAKRRRIALACVACRKRKSRCDGASPSCTLCRDFGYECHYTGAAASSRITVEKSYISTLEARVDRVEQWIARQESQAQRQQRSKQISSPQSNGLSPFDEDEGVRNKAGEEGFVDAMGVITFASEEETAYFGPSSNVAFLRYIARGIANKSSQPWSPSFPGRNRASDHGFASICRSGLPSPSDRRMASHINLFELPAPEDTRRLINAFFVDTATLFPYLHRETFLNAYTAVGDNNWTKVRRTWLGLLNMVLALATSAVVDSRVSAPNRMAASDIFYRRAVDLCRERMMRGATLEIVQCSLLMGQYLQGTHDSVQAWVVHGIAVKAAYALGLHCNHAPDDISPLEREVRKRTWFGCVVLDRTLSMTFGRPPSIPESFVRIEAPKPYHLVVPGLEEDPNEFLTVGFFNATINLYRIMSQVIDSLYSQNIGCDTIETNDTILRLFQLEQELSKWKQSVIPELTVLSVDDPMNLTSANAFGSSTFLKTRFSNILTLRYLNLRLLLHRPILNKILNQDASDLTAAHEGLLLQQVGQNSLQTCMKSAHLIIATVKEAVSGSSAEGSLLGAWWFTLYYIFNASLVIIVSFLGHLNLGAEMRSSYFTADSVFATLQQAISTMKALDNDNHTIDRCCYYLEQLVLVCANICDYHGYSSLTMPAGIAIQHDVQVNGGATSLMPHNQDLDFGQFLLESDFDFVAGHLNTRLGEEVTSGADMLQNEGRSL
ncbi:uncharacterized protein M421DRAFT_426386 [Didymella exigua CBS 183.55]|uniref:Zn(2)-C6 fungal-type domain-containing protein n=1 Tax=Didymella exigua CBS 183.55 TaxID=1150837 RepID=A0A6A5R6P1_9PLEO|nr:uncharacterized protein M421DRAFT_426386 [Didymella exigua CBS 183.55]KAF1922890.1 hypothetical protein M421DRAFT_426386 [Didymella exigua CBS 183.55]